MGNLYFFLKKSTYIQIDAQAGPYLSLFRHDQGGDHWIITRLYYMNHFSQLLSKAALF